MTVLEDALAHDGDLTVRRIELDPLSGEDERELARSFLGGEAPEEVVEAVRKAVDGNPLFLEERLSSLIETGAVFRGEKAWRLDASVRIDVPEALERLIRSRVDRLGALSHDAVVAASVLGVEFGLAALRAVTDLDDQLEEVVAELCAAGLRRAAQTARACLPFPTRLDAGGDVQRAAAGAQRQLHARVAWSFEEPHPTAWRKWLLCSAITTPPPGNVIVPCTTSAWPATAQPPPSPTKRQSPPIERPCRSWPKTLRCRLDLEGVCGTAVQARRGSLAYRVATTNAGRCSAKLCVS